MVNVDVVQTIAAVPSEVSKVLLDHQNAGQFFDAKFSIAKSADEGEVFGGKGAIRNLKVLLRKKLFQVLKFRIANYTKYLFSSHKYVFKNHDRKFGFYWRLYKAVNYFEKNYENYEIYSYWSDWIVNEAKILNKKKNTYHLLI